MPDLPPPERNPVPDPPTPSSAPLQISLAYAACAAIWILFSDRALQAWFTDPGQIAVASAVKGWLFVAVTALLLYAVLRRRWYPQAVELSARPSPGLALKLLLAVVLAGAATALAIAYSVTQVKDTELLRLQAVTDLKVQQLSDWLAERGNDARMLEAASNATELARRWRDAGEPASREQLVERLTRLRALTHFSAVSLLDEQGDPLWHSEADRPSPDAAQRAALQASARQRQVQRQGPYLDASGRAHTDFVLPLQLPGSVPAPMLVFHMDGDQYLPARLREWPLPTRTGEVMLVRREGDQVVFLNVLNEVPDAALKLRLPVSDERLLSAQLIRAGSSARLALDGVNYNGQAAFGTGRQVPGTDWYLLAKTDLAEVYAVGVGQAIWIVLSGALALFVSVLGLNLARQGKALATVSRTELAQREHLQALQLLGAIVDASDDAIFAKDASGRYTLFNRAASQLVGKSPETVLGLDDHAVYLPDLAETLRQAGQRAVAAGHPITEEEHLRLADGERIFLATKGPLRDATGRVIGEFGISRDVTEAKLAEGALRRANRALLTSRECSQALMRANEVSELLSDVCQIVVHTGGYHMAWVGLAENDAARSVRPVAKAGHEAGYLEAVRISWADDAFGHGPTGTAIRERRPVVARDIPGDPSFAAWREAAAQRGYAASIAVPLQPSAGECIGALSIYSTDPAAFAADEILTVIELANDLAFGMRALRDRHARLDGERHLREEKDRYRALFASNPQPMWVYDRETLAFLEVNEAAVAKYGYSRDEFLAMRITDIRPPGDVPGVLEHLEARNGPPGAVGVWRHRLKDGRLIQVDLSSHGIEFGERPAVIVLAQDVTAQKQAEAALLESEHNYRTLTEQVPAIIYRARLDEASSTTYVSPAIQALGYSQAEWMAEPQIWLEALHPADRERVLAELDAAHRNSASFDLQYRLRSRDGRWHDIHDKADLVRDANGRALYLQGLMLDISERMHTEAELRKLYQAVEQSPNSIVITNLKAEIEYVNEAFLSTTGYSREEIIGRNPRILHADDVSAVDHAGLWQALSQGRAWKGEFHNKRKDGSTYIEFAHVAPLRQPDGSITHYVGVKEDISEKKRIGNELDRYRQHLEELVEERTVELAEARHRAEAANLAKSAFLANMSHEIRTPMNAIVGLTYLLQHEPLTKHQADRLAQISGSAHHLLAIINGILDLSKIEAGKVALDESDFHLSALLDHVHGLIVDRALAKGVQVIVEREGVPSWLFGDLTRLRQALLNYADNAVKFTQRGSIRLRARLLEETGERLLLRFEVQDTGIGIAADQLPRLFQAFEQADSSTTRKFGGTGLGLAVARRLAGLMGGEAGVDSQPGVGSSFWFTARLRRGQVAATEATPPVDQGNAEAALRELCAGARVLLAEDDAINREVAIELLHAAGLRVDTALDGRDALQQARQMQHDLVLMDVQMPLMDGFEATQAIRALPGLADLPILAMTASTFEDDRRACLAAGMNDFVPKPVDPEVLYATLLRWLPRHPRVQRPGSGAGAVAPRPADPPPNDQEQQALAALESVAGLCPERGLLALRGDLRGYLRLLRQFAESHGGDAQQIADDLVAGRVDAAQKAVHTLKGAAGTLGATALQDAADALETALRQPEAQGDPNALCRTLQQLSERLFPALAALPALPALRPPEPPDLARALAVLDELEPLIARDDTAAGEHFEAARALLTASLGASALSLGRQLEAFDFSAALLSLRSIRARLQSGTRD